MEILNNAKKHSPTLVATFDQDANHVLITHKRNHHVSSTYECCMNTGELDGNGSSNDHILTPLEMAWLKSIDSWIDDCYESV